MDSFESRLVERYDGRPDVPPGLAKMMFDFAVAVVSESPADIEQFAVDHFTRLRQGHFSSTSISHNEYHRTTHETSSTTVPISRNDTPKQQTIVMTNYDIKQSFSSQGASPSSLYELPPSGNNTNSRGLLMVPDNDRGQRTSVASNITSTTNRWTAEYPGNDENGMKAIAAF